MQRIERAPVSVGQGVTVHPDIMAGEPCVDGQRMPVIQIKRCAKYGWGVDKLIAEFPDMTPAKIADALAWSALKKRHRKQLVKDALKEFLEDMF